MSPKWATSAPARTSSSGSTRTRPRVHGEGHPGPPAASHRAERRDLRHRDRGAEPRLKLKPGMTANVRSRSPSGPTSSACRIPPSASGRPRTSSRRSTRNCRPSSSQRGGAGGGAAAPTWPAAGRAAGPGGQGGRRRRRPRPGAAPQQAQAGADAARAQRGGGDATHGRRTAVRKQRPAGAGTEPGSVARVAAARAGGGSSRAARAARAWAAGRRRAARIRPERPRGRKRMVERYQADAGRPEGAVRRADEGARDRHRGARSRAAAKPRRRRRRGAEPRRMSGADDHRRPVRPAASEVEGRVYVWLASEKQLKSVRLRLGVSDGQYTELLEGDLPAERGTGDGGHARHRVGQPEPVAVALPADAAAARRHARRPGRRRTLSSRMRRPPCPGTGGRRRPSTSDVSRAAGLQMTALCLSSPFAT